MGKRKIIFIITIALVLTALASTLFVYSAINSTVKLTSSGIIVKSQNHDNGASSLGVFSDNTCTVPLTSLNWGSISPGMNSTITLYVKNTATTGSLTLDMAATNWSPTNANGPLAVSWDQEGTTLAPGQSAQATLILSVSSTITQISSFSVQISIVGS